MSDDQERPAADAVSTSPRPRLALRITLGILLAGGMTYGCTAMGRQKSRKQAEAVQEITLVGGQVYFDYQWSDGRAVSDGKPQQAAWLRRLVGAEFFDRAVAVDLRGVRRPGNAVSWLTLLPYLAGLNASGVPLDDDHLTTVRRLTGLSHLDLSATSVTDEGLEQLARLANLTYLSLASTTVSDQSVGVLSQLRKLRRLDLSETSVSDEAMANLERRLPKCQVIRRSEGGNPKLETR